jgi:threonine/homoserine/homoserine lactone efflux protein
VIQIETLMMFFTASVLLALAPGPDNIFVITLAAQHGSLAGLIVTLGFCTGLVVHTTAVALGIAAVFQASMTAFAILKSIGACYLFYLAWLTFRNTKEETRAVRKTNFSRWQLYCRGIIMNVTNPKVLIFSLAFLPQFVDPEHGHLTLQFLILGGAFICSTILVFGCVAVLAGVLGQQLINSYRVKRIMNWVAGTVFIALALKLITTKR